MTKTTLFKELILCFALLATTGPIFLILNAQKLIIIKNGGIFCKFQQKDSTLRMVELKSRIPTIEYDLRYATVDNFVNQKLYKNGNQTFLRLPVATALGAIQKELNKKGYSLKVFDAYRPYRVTKKMWDIIQDERYVADPAKGSGHNRGIAVDVTIVDRDTGRELDMGTGFDNFTDTAHHTFTRLPSGILQNRLLLKETMTKYGFHTLETEWWHYSWPNDRNYSVLDLSFKTLAKLSH